jgi:hypothetical protein
MQHTRTGSPIASSTLLVVGVGLCLVLGWRSLHVNLGRACIVNDTPYLGFCAAAKPAQAQTHDLRTRIAANPGDTRAYVQLAQLETSPARQQLVDTAATLAPALSQVLSLQAAAAIERADWRKAVPPLIKLAQYYHNPGAAQLLAQLLANGQGPLLEEHVSSGKEWIPKVLEQMPQAKAPFSTALPLIAVALKQGVLQPDSIAPYVGRLKSAGAWTDAYSLWVTLHGKPLPTLYNASFDQEFALDGFDWEIAAQTPVSRAGAVIDRGRIDGRGAVLDIRFTGRALAVPLVRQHVFLGEGRYRLRGDYVANQLRFENGLAWTVRCSTAGAQVAGRSAALGNTESWRPFQFEFVIPPGCGAVATIQLEPLTQVDAAVGTRGRASFDSFALERIGR